ncbi:MAG TPA: hypothetical protein VF125_10820 [Solirubrobacterales bacterium]
MENENETTVRVVVKLRDLDTDAESIFVHAVAPPHDLGEQRERLVRAVGEHKPRAEIRSFANHAASFVDGEHLVVAYFENPAQIPAALKRLDGQLGQDELFSAAPGQAAA